MPRHIWSVLCSHSVIDKDSNNISLFEILEEVRIGRSLAEKQLTEPVALAIFTLQWVSLWAREPYGKPSVTDAKDSVLDPSGAVIWDRSYQIDLTNHERSRVRRIIGNPPFKESGQYQFRTQIKDEDTNTWQEVASVPLTVLVQEEETK